MTIATASRPHTAPRGWWLMLALAVAIAGYGLSFTWRGLDAFGANLRPSFEQRPVAIWLHVVFGPLALVTGALNFRHAIRRARPALHRRIGELYLLSALMTGVAGGWLAPFADAGPIAQAGFGTLALATFATTAIAYREVRARRFREHRRWMIRSYALILAAVTLRFELPLLAMSLGAFEPAYRIIGWACWVPNLLLAEWIVRRTPHVA